MSHAEKSVPGASAPALTILMQPVKSTNITALGYDTPTKTLEVHFGSGGKYRYADVSPESFTAFLQADSKGSYFARHIRGLHTSTPVPKPPEPTTKPTSAWPFPTTSR